MLNFIPVIVAASLLSACSCLQPIYGTAKDYGSQAVDAAKDYGGRAVDTTKDAASAAKNYDQQHRAATPCTNAEGSYACQVERYQKSH